MKHIESTDPTCRDFGNPNWQSNRRGGWTPLTTLDCRSCSDHPTEQAGRSGQPEWASGAGGAGSSPAGGALALPGGERSPDRENDTGTAADRTGPAGATRDPGREGHGAREGGLWEGPQERNAAGLTGESGNKWPEPGWPVWGGVDDGTAQVVVFGSKRHGALDDDGDLVEMTEAGMIHVDPPAMRGRNEKGYRRWSAAAVRRYRICRRVGARPQALRSEAPWDTGSALPFPALQRFQVRHSVQLRSLPTDLGARPGTGSFRVSGSELGAPGRTFVALDPGGDLSDWQTLTWFDTQTGECVSLSMDFADIASQIVETLDERAIRYSDPPSSEPIDEVIVDREWISHRGARLRGHRR